MNVATAGYLMEDPREARRLAEKVDPAAWVTSYLGPYLADGARVLDVGCGPGTIAAYLARTAAIAQVVGLDRSPARVRVARELFAELPKATALQGDATALAFRDETFDLVYARFLLEYLPQRQQVVTEMARVCRPGGVVVLQDLDGQLVQHYPPDPVLQAGIEATLAKLAATGFDPFVGRKLFQLTRVAGLAALDARVEGYHVVAGPIDELARRWWELKLDIALRAVSQALGSEQAATALKDRVLAYLDRDDTLTWSDLFTVWSTKR